ncbi:MAG: hypothetical protein NTZ33_06560 [Bacteroidetes bacterium]|nr:hypothetical protein [Bacteroidota bacterium]
MFKKHIFLCLVVSLLIPFQSLYSQQIRNFPKDQQLFLEEVKSFFYNDKNLEKETKLKIDSMFMDFDAHWNTTDISDEQKTQIITASNLMLKAKLRAYPNFYNFYSCISIFKNSKQKENSYTAWFKGVISLLDAKKVRYFAGFLETTENLLKSNFIYNSRNVCWYSSNDDYYFVNDSSLRIVFPSLDLCCLASKDSSVVLNTKGVYYPIDNKWIGEGGKISWERAGFPPNDVYAYIGKYSIDLKFAKYTIDSVRFFYPAYFKSFLTGSLQEKIMADITEDKASYPRFNSYEKNVSIKNLFPNVDYEGGFAINGNKVIGTGDSYYDAKLIFKKDNKEFVHVTSKLFVIRTDKVSSSNASVIIYWKEDSIYQPNLEMKYLNDFKELTLIRGMNDVSKSPFFNTYHKLDMYIEAMYWKMDEAKIDFSMVRSPGRTSLATFESFNYYSEARFAKLQGIDEINPIYKVKQYMDAYGINTFTVSDLAKYIKIDADQVKAMLINLANLGFLIYNPSDETVFVKDKVREYIKALNKKIDYDAIQFRSTVENGVNASLSLLNFDLKIKGVPIILLSDSQQVFIFPTNAEVIVKKNRDFLFTGLIHAGNFDYFSKNSSFQYDDFKLNMPVIDSMSIKVESFVPDEKGERPLVRLKTVIQNLRGEILVDYPTNKAGLKPYPEYPVFKSKDESYVYYDKQYIQNGAYEKNKFFYHLQPFIIKNLDRIKTDSLRFDGSLTSAGIFPEIFEPLRVQPDYSLGFVRNTPPAGLANYGGKARYFNKIDLSNMGLRGNGKLDYLTSTSLSNNFIFLPDSMHAVTQNFDIKEQTALTEYPQLTVTNVNQRWFPYRDSMLVAQIDTAFAMYNRASQLNGMVMLTPKGLSGKGKMVFEKAEMESNLYSFKQHLFDADTANFRLRTYDLTDLAFNTENYKSHIDFQKRKGEFKSNSDASKVNFPVNKYICYMDFLEWFMDKDELALKNTKKTVEENIDKLSLKELISAKLPGSDFVSTHPSQDSLRFKSPRALFNMKDYILTAEDVKLIKVADAAIAPADGKVVILRQAEMSSFTNATIVANRTNKYHSFYNATVSVRGRQSYFASANYDYVDENDIKFKLFFDKMGVDPNLRTYANGTISDSSDFALSPAFDFAGSVQLKANREFLTFSGGTRINQLCDESAKTWLKFSAEINPKQIFIPIDADPKATDGRKLAAAILYANTAQIYTSFAGPKRFYSDTAVVSASGFLTYNKPKNEYIIASKEKLLNPDTLGNKLVLDITNCVTTGDGNINMGTNLGRMQMASFGRVTNNMRSNEATFDLVMTVNFFFQYDAMKMMGKSLYTNNSLSSIENSNTGKVKNAYYEILGEKGAEKVINELNMYGSLRKVPDALDKTFMLTDVKLRYDSITKSFVSMGAIGIGNVGKDQINKYVKGNLQIIKKRSGDIFTLYLELDDAEWYFFTYSNNLMQAYSSIKSFNDFITLEKPKNRRLEAENGMPAYSYYLSTERKKTDFLKKMQAIGATGDEIPPPQEPEKKEE